MDGLRHDEAFRTAPESAIPPRQLASFVARAQRGQSNGFVPAGALVVQAATRIGARAA
jgi:hypothetical protein